MAGWRGNLANRAAKAGVAKAAPQPPSAQGGAALSSRIRASLGPLYMRIPALPLLGRSGTAALLATAALYILFTAAIFLTLPKTEISVGIAEAPLAKNAQLSIMPGESYSYEVSSPQGISTVYYEISSSPSCAGAVVAERAGSSSGRICLLPSGNLAQAGFEKVNSGLGNSSILLFAPWMLAASENFGWQVNSTASAGGMQISTPIYFRSSGRKSAAGRDAYEITVRSGGQQQARFLVDSEKRVALLIDSGSLSARLVSAPFPLDWGNNSSQKN